MRPESPRLRKSTAEEFVELGELAPHAAREPDRFREWLEQHDAACARALAELVDAEIARDVPADAGHA